MLHIRHMTSLMIHLLENVEHLLQDVNLDVLEVFEAALKVFG